MNKTAPAPTDSKTHLSAKPGERTITVTRIFDAPRALVWEATTRPEHVRYWWGLKASRLRLCQMDFRVGGTWRYELARKGSDAIDPFTGEYREIQPPERLVRTFRYDRPEFREFVATETATYVEIDGGRRTLLTVVIEHQTVAARDGHVQSGMEGGMNETHGRLDDLLAVLQRMRSKPAPKVGEDVVIVRTFAAPRALVFECWTDPKHLARWWGPYYFDAPRCEIDARPGGAIHIDMRGPDGTTFPMTGTVHEVVPRERLVYTSRAYFEGSAEPQIEVLNTVVFTESAGQTIMTLTVKVLHASGVALPALSGMEEGWSQSLQKLAELVAERA
jgi:uncharacterized protein YndB with AHSA1/START domain